MDVVHPVQINLPVVVGDDRDLATLDRRNGAVGQRLDLDKPLRGKPRLYSGSAAVALAERDGVVLFAHQKVAGAQIVQHLLARFVAIEPRVAAGVLIHHRVLVHEIDLRQIVSQSRLKVIGIVRRRHLHRAGSELRLRQFVGNDRNLALHQRQQNFLAVQVLIAFVLSRLRRPRYRPAWFPAAWSRR